jgi:hypothetical protein
MLSVSSMLVLGGCVMVAGCSGQSASKNRSTFQDDLDFLESHVEVVLLKDDSGQAQVAVVPEWQGRVIVYLDTGDVCPLSNHRRDHSVSRGSGN